MAINDKPIGSGENPVTYDEGHTIILGMVGILAVVAVHLGFTSLAVFGSGFLLAIVFGVEERYLRLLGERGRRAAEACRRTPAAKTLLRIEPWYFIGSFIASGLATWLVLELLLGGFGA